MKTPYRLKYFAVNLTLTDVVRLPISSCIAVTQIHSVNVKYMKTESDDTGPTQPVAIQLLT